MCEVIFDTSELLQNTFSILLFLSHLLQLIFFNCMVPFPLFLSSKRQTIDKTSICLLTIIFTTHMMNNHLCYQSTNMSTYRSNSPEAGTQCKTWFCLIHIHHAWTTTEYCTLYGNTHTSVSYRQHSFFQ